MPVTPTYPGVYIEEVPSGVHPITGVATSITALRRLRPARPGQRADDGPELPRVQRVFGGLWSESTMSYAVQQFFLNGGRDALIVRARTTGRWGHARHARNGHRWRRGAKNLTLERRTRARGRPTSRVRIDHDTKDKDETTPVLYNVSVKDVATGFVEVIRNLPLGARRRPRIIEQQSRARATTTPDGASRRAHGRPSGDDPFDPAVATRFSSMSAGEDGTHSGEADLVPARTTGTGCTPLHAPISSTSSASHRSSMRATRALDGC